MISDSWHLFYAWPQRLLGMLFGTNLHHFSLYRLHRCGKCSASTGLHSISCFRHLFQSAGSGCMHENFSCVNAFLCCSSVISTRLAIRPTHNALLHLALERSVRGLECTQHSVHSKS